MGYLLLSIALLAGCIKGFCGKKLSVRVISLKGTLYVSFLRMLLCSLIGFFVLIPYGIESFKIDVYTLIITALSGISTAMFVIVWIICVRKGAYVMIDVFLMLGVGVTVVLCRIFFCEKILITQSIGFLLLLIAALIMCVYSSNIKGELNVKNILLLILCGMFNGLADFSQKWFVYSSPNKSIGVFNFYTYLFSAIVIVCSFLILNKNEQGDNDGKSIKNALIVFLMAISLFAYSYFKTSSAKYIPSAILYPLSSGAAIVLSTVMASTFFGEKITPKCAIGVFITIVSLVVMNFQLK